MDFDKKSLTKFFFSEKRPLVAIVFFRFFRKSTLSIIGPISILLQNLNPKSLKLCPAEVRTHIICGGRGGGRGRGGRGGTETKP